MELAPPGTTWRVGAGADAGFTPVQVIADPPLALPAPSSSKAASVSEDSRIEITLPDGTCVRVGADVGLGTLRRVMAAVRR